MSHKLTAEIIEPTDGQATSTVIWLHGLGANGQDFMPVVERYPNLITNGVRFIFPDAPVRAITINQGMEMRGWYDIANLDMNQQEDEQGIRLSEVSLLQLIERELDKGIDSSKIVLAGFSQGGALALHTGLRLGKPLAGIVALSCYLPLNKHFSTERSIENQETPIFIAHGMFDPIVPLQMGEQTKNVLSNLDYTTQWHSYPMQHTVNDELIVEIGKFLENVLIK
jgi:phospholipase/carboxylesterase